MGVYIYTLIFSTELEFCTFYFSDGTFGYKNGPLIFKKLDFGIDMSSRGMSVFFFASL